MDPEVARQLADLFRQPGALENVLQETQQVVDQAQPKIHVPVREVPPPVELRGKIDLYIRVAWENIAGVETEEIKRRVISVLEGARHPWLPQIYLGELEIWREVESDPGPRASVGGTVSGTYHLNDQQDAGYIDVGANAGEGVNETDPIG